MVNPVKLVYTINSSDLNLVGEQLGYDWNEVCDEIDKYEFYGSVEDGSIVVTRDTSLNLIEDYGIKLGSILSEIFSMNPNAKNLHINNQ